MINGKLFLYCRVQGQQPSYPIASQTQNQQPPTGAWSQQNVNRLSIQQQQNPMLNAQLTVRKEKSM